MAVKLSRWRLSQQLAVRLYTHANIDLVPFHSQTRQQPPTAAQLRHDHPSHLRHTLEKPRHVRLLLALRHGTTSRSALIIVTPPNRGLGVPLLGVVATQHQFPT